MHIAFTYKDSPTFGAVLAIFFDRKHGGETFNQFIDSLNFSETQIDEPVEVNNVMLASFLSKIDFSKYWNYEGSLTSPPCQEGIHWTIIK